jgi:single-strand DNA-binding protein
MTGLRDHLGWRRIPDVVVGRLQQRSWTAEDGSARSTVEVIADELGPSLRWATATTTRTTRSQDQ